MNFRIILLSSIVLGALILLGTGCGQSGASRPAEGDVSDSRVFNFPKNRDIGSLYARHQGLISAATGEVLISKDAEALLIINEFGGEDISPLAELNSKDFWGLQLPAHQITDADLVHLKEFTTLKSFVLMGTNITDAGLLNLPAMLQLKTLDVGSTSITDKGLAWIGGLTALEELSISSTAISDAGLFHLHGLSSLRELNMHITRISDEGLYQLRNLTSLVKLDLRATRITDAGLAHLHNLTSLRTLMLNDTRVSAKGIRALRAALPQCRIIS